MFTPPIIADTNIFVAAGFNADSASRQIIDAVDDGRLLQVWNGATRRETLAILDQIPPLDKDRATPLFRDTGHYTHSTSPDDFQIVGDREDRKFAALAHACGVILITNDSDLLDVRSQLGVLVLRPSTFVKRRKSDRPG